jgi:hypothetical protein
MHPRAFTTPFRCVAAALVAAHLVACTKQVAVPEVPTRHFAVDWERSGVQPFAINDLSVQGIVLTPAQWPLEGSLKRLLSGDFIGVIDALDFRFRSATLPEGALREIYGAGYLPVYARVHNPGAETRGIFPETLVVKAEPERELNAVPADSLPRTLSKLDWERTAVVTLAALLVVVALVAGRDSGNGSFSPAAADVGVRVIAQQSTAPDAAATTPGEAGARSKPGMLEAGVVQPGETREGFVFFAHRGLTIDWPTARLAAP